MTAQVQWYEQLQTAVTAHAKETEDAAAKHTKITSFFQYKRTLRPRQHRQAILYDDTDDDSSDSDPTYQPEDSDSEDDRQWDRTQFDSERIKGKKYARAPSKSTHQKLINHHPSTTANQS